MLDLGPQTRRRRTSLTPMIDVVFLLLVFFMLAARFGLTETVPLTLSAPGAQPYEGPPRLVTIRPDDLDVNGIVTETPAADLHPLLTDPDDLIILRARDGASVQRLLEVMTTLRQSGLTQLVVLE